MIKKLKKALTEVALQSIDFSHESADWTTSALHVFPLSPSWVPEHFSYTAYSISDAKQAAEENLLKVWARFMKDTPQGSVQIRTINTTPRLPEGMSEKVFERYEGKGALGHIEPTRVFFGKSGQSVHRGKNSNVPFNISDSKFHELGVGIYDIIWLWEYRTLASSSTDEETVWNKRWIPFERSMHRIFITVDCPKAPWSPTPFSDLNRTSSASPIWTEALQIACTWARGSHTIDEAGQRIADSLFSSGFFEYHPDSHYSKAEEGEASEDLIHFHLSKVIERLQGGNGLGEKINCLDCSLIVASLTNVLGGNLHIGKLQHTEDTDYSDPEIILKNRFEINTIKAIGKDVESTMAGLESDGHYYFSFHSIAWQPANSEIPDFKDPKNIIYDACVQFVDCKEDFPAATASGILLGENDDPSGYRKQLATATNEGIGACKAQQSTVRQIRLQ